MGQADGMPPPDRWLNVQELADYLGFSRATIYRLVAEGRIPCRRLHGTGVRFAPEDVAEIERSSERPPYPARAKRLKAPKRTP